MIKISVNGEVFEVWIEPRKTLSQALRENLHLMGTKIGCDVGDCGACALLVDGVAVLSCLTA